MRISYKAEKKQEGIIRPSVCQGHCVPLKRKPLTGFGLMIEGTQGIVGTECSANPHHKKRPALASLFVLRDATSRKVYCFNPLRPQAGTRGVASRFTIEGHPASGTRPPPGHPPANRPPGINKQGDHKNRPAHAILRNGQGPCVHQNISLYSLITKTSGAGQSP